MSQAPNPFTQAASQGYGEFAPTLDEEDDEEQQPAEEEKEDEEEPEGPESPEPENQEMNELGFTQTQERSYPTGIDSPGGDENDDDAVAGEVETSDNEQEREDDETAGPSSPTPDALNEQEDDEEAGPSSPLADALTEQGEEEEEAGPSSPTADTSNEQQEEDEDNDTNKKQSRRRVQIMNDSDNEEEKADQTESTSVVSKDKSPHFLKQFTMKNDDSHKKHKKRRSDEHQHHHEKKSKRFRKTSNDEEDKNTEEQQEKHTENVEATSDVEDVVDDIFGKDANEEEGNDQEEVAAELADLNEEAQEEEEDTARQETFDAGDDDDDDDDEAPIRKNNDFAKKSNIGYDIDLYLEKRAEKRRGNRRRGGKNGDIDLAGPDTDEFVKKLIDQMNIATEEDRLFNKSRQPATAKLLLLPIVEQHLFRADLTEIFLDNGILTTFKDWLSPLPDRSLSNIKIRESIIKILQQFGVVHADPLRDSGIGKALMYLYKHPRETKENKIKLIKIIHDWARPIFHLDTDYKHLTREERQQRDADQASLKRQTSLTGKPKNRRADVDLPFSSDRRQDDDDEKDDDCPRARVPRPSNKDYVVRPISSVEYSEKKGDSKKKTVSRLDEVKRRQQDRKRLAKPMSIVKLSIEGNKMHL